MKDFRKPQQTFYFIYLDHGHSRPHQSQPQHPQGVWKKKVGKNMKKNNILKNCFIEKQ